MSGTTRRRLALRHLGAAGLALAALWACASSESTRPPKPLDAAAELRQAARKVDYAILETKRMILRSRGADSLPDLYMRLADLYTERGRYAWLMVYEERRARGDSSRAIEAPEARLLKTLAISTYDRLLREFPKYSQGDLALFLMAHEHRELGEFAEMKATYERLVATYPQSSHRMEAFLILGDAEFDHGNLDGAERYYDQVLAEPESHVHPLARYKLAWVKVNREDCKGAVKLFERILRDKSTPHGAKNIVSTQRSLNIRRESLLDIAYCYPEVSPNRPAEPYFKELADSSSDYVAGMRRAANRFVVKQLFGQAAAALREVLAATASDEEAVESARKLYDVVTKAKSYDHAAADVERIGRVLESRAHDTRLPADARKRLSVEFEVYARDLATRSHLAAKASKAPGALQATAAAYTAYLDYFRDAPSAHEIEENRAEALLMAQEHYEAAQAFEALLRRERDPAKRHQQAQNAIFGYQQALDKGELTRLERLRAWAGIRKAGATFIAESPQDPKVIQVKLAIAKSYYDSGQYPRAAELMYALARQYPQSPEAIAGGHLALDSLRLAEDWEGLTSVGRRLLADQRLADPKFKQEVADIIAKAEQRQITELTVTGGADQEQKLMALAERRKGSGMGEQALYNALIIARDHGDIERFYKLGEEFLATYQRSPRRADVMGALASLASDRADYAQAAGYLEANYVADPTGKESLERLYAAASIRAFLGEPQAAQDLRQLVQRGAGGRAEELLLVLARAGNFGAVEEVLKGSSASGPVADFLRGYLALQRGDKEDAAKRLDKVARLHPDGGPALEAVARARFLVGELAFEAFSAPSAAPDPVAALQEKSEQLNQVDRAYAQAIQSRGGSWGLAGLARVADAYARFAAFLRGLTLPSELSPDEQKQLKQVLTARADEASKRSGELRAQCKKRAQETIVPSDVAKSCLSDQPIPEKIPIYPHPLAARRAGDPATSAKLRDSLGKKPGDVDLLLKLAEAYLDSGDLRMSLLILDRAEEIDARRSELWDLRGVTLARAGDADGAFEALTKAVTLDRSNARARVNLAAHLYRYGYSARAAAELKRAGGLPQSRGEADHPDLAALAQLGGGGASGKRKQ
jgi:Flp pilus assembly protein TadD